VDAGSSLSGVPAMYPIKTQALRAASRVTPMAYGLGKHGWVTVALDQPECPDAVLLRDWIDESYAIVAPKMLAARLNGPTDAR
jgi:predicted DNA-binding protein (MmcQ/YjbR family)